MPTRIWRDWRVSLKLTAGISLLVAATVGSITAVAVVRETAVARRDLIAQADLILGMLESVTVDALHTLDVDRIADVLQALGERGGLVSGHVYGPNGRLIVALGSDDDTNSAVPDPYATQLLSVGHIIEWEDDRLAVGHVVTAGAQRLGAISVALPTQTLQRRVAANRLAGALAALVAAAIGSGVAMLIGRSITAPLQQLVTATQRISSGELTGQVPVTGRDELGSLASAFNSMIRALQDILDQLRSSEERFALAVRGANDGLWDWDLQSGHIYFSPRWVTMAGYAEDEVEPSEAGFLGLVHPDDAENVRAAVREHFSGNAAHFEVEYRLQHKNGSYRWMLARGLVVRDEHGESVRMAGSQTDITRRREAELQIRGALEMKDSMLKEIHHRVKNNLQVVSSLLNLQARRVADPRDARLFESSRNRVRSMAFIHEKLYKPKALEEARIDFADYLRDLVASLIRTYAEQRVEVEVDAEEHFLGLDSATPCGLIVNELVSNALEHAFSGAAGRIRVEFRRQEDRYVLLVADNGPGLPAGVDIHDSDSLGLRLVDSLCEQLDATVDCRSNGGVTWTVSFIEPAVAQGVTTAT